MTAPTGTRAREVSLRSLTATRSGRGALTHTSCRLSVAISADSSRWGRRRDGQCCKGSGRPQSRCATWWGNVLIARSCVCWTVCTCIQRERRAGGAAAAVRVWSAFTPHSSRARSTARVLALQLLPSIELDTYILRYRISIQRSLQATDELSCRCYCVATWTGVVAVSPPLTTADSHIILLARSGLVKLRL